MGKNLEQLRPYREEVCQMIEGITQELFKVSDISLFRYGSVEQGIGLDTSDIDMAV